MANAQLPPFVSVVPNRFPQPTKPGNLGLAAFDAAYSMAPFLIGPEDALLLRGRWPHCRCANVSLWTRHQQTLDYGNRPISLNRAQTRSDADGRFTLVLAHGDPGHDLGRVCAVFAAGRNEFFAPWCQGRPGSSPSCAPGSALSHGPKSAPQG